MITSLKIVVARRARFIAICCGVLAVGPVPAASAQGIAPAPIPSAKVIVISGSVRDCFMDAPITVGGVDVLIFQLEKSRPIVKKVMALYAISEVSLSGLEGDTADLFFSRYDQLIDVVKKARPLAQTKSRPDGSFTATFPAVDSVLMFAYAEQEDQPTFYSWRIMRARSDSALDMDMGGGGCPSPESDRKTVRSREDIAQWRGSPVPDEIDSLIASAISAEGEFRGDDTEWEFTGSEGAIEVLKKLPKAVPRLIDCLQWNRRARATYNGTRVLVGVVCYQAIVGSAYVRRLHEAKAYPQGITDAYNYQNPSIEALRKAHYTWLETLKRHRP